MAPQFTCRLYAEAIPMCANVNRTSSRSPIFSCDAGMSHPPSVVHAVAVLVLPAKPSLWDFGALGTRLPPGTWKLGDTQPVSATDVAIAIGLGTWKFERYRAKKAKPGAKILWPADADKARATATIEAIQMARDLITTPSSDMGPAELAGVAQMLAKRHKAKIVAQLRYEYALNLIHRLGGTMTRIGLDFA